MVGGLAPLIPALPMLAFVVIVALGWESYLRRGSVRISGSLAGGISIAGVCAAWLLAILVFAGAAQGGPPVYHRYPWLVIGHLEISFGWMVDPMTAVMLIVVTTVGALVQIYSVGYMKDDPKYPMFFSYLSLFTSAMLGLVVANNLLELFVSWEIMGLASYLLIGFWFEKPTAMRAAKKAFVVTRVGDIGLFFGMVWLALAAGTLDFGGSRGLVIAPVGDQGLGITGGPGLVALAGSATLGWIALLIFCGSIGKSAQFPLHVWLPDAMEGPTPVSALIHAATMVAAGVYLVARMYPVFDMAGAVPLLGLEARPLACVAVIGVITALLAAVIAITQSDIKRILAYSTISQLGFMMIGLGSGGEHGDRFIALGLSAGIFHLMTHAYFKGLLFLGSGSVIHGTGTQDIWEMGGLWVHMRVTAWTFAIGSAALMGLPFITSGFFSKDAILETALEFHPAVFWLAVLGATLTAFYMTRLWMVAFMGTWSGGPRAVERTHAGSPAPGHGAHGTDAEEESAHAGAHGHTLGTPHESPSNMTAPLIVLAALSVVAGYVGWPGHHLFNQFVRYQRAGVGELTREGGFNPLVVAASFLAVAVGVSLGVYLYPSRRFRFASETPGPLAWALYRLSLNKFYFDEVYQRLLVWPLFRFSTGSLQVDRWGIDLAVNGVGWFGRQVAYLSGLVDRWVVDGLVNLVGLTTRFAGGVLRRVQTGQVQNYVFVVFLGTVFLIWAVFQVAPRGG
jgi:NADH-quinone oxidoreductase subunit L